MAPPPHAPGRIGPGRIDRRQLHPVAFTLALVAVMAVFVALAARDLVMLLNDVTSVFEGVAARANRLVMPMVAFLTYYALVILVFTFLCRVVEMVLGQGQFRVFGFREIMHPRDRGPDHGRARPMGKAHPGERRD